MLNTQCHCGQMKNPNARECMTCANQSRRKKLKGVRHSEGRVRNIRAARQRQQADGHRNFDLAAYMRTQPHPFAKPAGATRVVKDGRVVVKCEDGKWRYRSRLVWAEANGPIPAARVIHHKDLDPMNDDLGNLQMLTIGEHMKIHNELRRES